MKEEEYGKDLLEQYPGGSTDTDVAILSLKAHA
jgi:hypothetical protein